MKIVRTIFFLFLTVILPMHVSAEARTRILIPLPHYGFDPTEVAIPWVYMQSAQFHITFATPSGAVAQADRIMLTGKGLGLLKGQLRAKRGAREAYSKLIESQEFQSPLSYEEINSEDYDALYLPGGHDKGMREYLGSKIIQQVVVKFFEKEKIVGAICHGTLLAARSISPATGRSVLYGRKTTGLTRNQELIAYHMTKFMVGDYYRTYPELDHNGQYVTMADELKSYLESPSDFLTGPGRPIPMRRDSFQNLSRGFVVRDGNYLSARWPGDAHRLGSEFIRLLREKTSRAVSL